MFSSRRRTFYVFLVWNLDGEEAAALVSPCRFPKFLSSLEVKGKKKHILLLPYLGVVKVCGKYGAAGGINLPWDNFLQREQDSLFKAPAKDEDKVETDTTHAPQRWIVPSFWKGAFVIDLANYFGPGSSWRKKRCLLTMWVSNVRKDVSSWRWFWRALSVVIS